MSLAALAAVLNAANMASPAGIVLGLAILGTPAILLIWGWLSVLRRETTVGPVLCLLLLTATYALALASIFNSSFQTISDRWHGVDIGIYFFIAVLTCAYSFIRPGPSRKPLFSAGLVLSIFYFAAIWFMGK